MRSSLTVSCWSRMSLCTFVACVALCASIRAEETIALRPKMEPGQFWTFDQSYQEQMKSTRSIEGQSESMVNDNRYRRMGQVEVLSAKGGLATSLRVRFGADCESVMEYNAQVKKVPFPFAGQTITLKRAEDGSISTDAREAVDAGSMTAFRLLFERDLPLYPDKQVAVGEKWKADAAIVNQQLGTTGPKDSGAISLELLAVRETGGTRAAEISIRIESTKDMGGVLRKTDNAGTALIDLQTGRVIKLTLKGPMSIAGTSSGPGPNGRPIAVQWEGKGDMSFSVVSEAGIALPPGHGAGATDGTGRGAVPPATGDRAPAGGAADAKTISFQMGRLMDDPEYIGGEVSRFLIPAGWKFDGKMAWDMAMTLPAQARWRAFDPHGPAEFEGYPTLLFTWRVNRNGLGPPLPPLGSKSAGGIFAQPVNDQFTAILQVVLPAYRKDLLKARVVDKEKLPKLAEYVFKHNFDAANNRQSVFAGRMRFEYTVDGQPVEEDVTAVLTLNAPQFGGSSWRISDIYTTRAPKGSIDEVRQLRMVMQRSLRPDFQWNQAMGQIALGANKAKIAEIQEIGRRSREAFNAANRASDAQKQAFEAHIKDIGDRALVVDQYIRDVTPYNSTQGPPVELPSGYNHVWQGNNGQYIQTNDPNYNPASDPNNQQYSWTKLSQAQ